MDLNLIKGQIEIFYTSVVIKKKKNLNCHVFKKVSYFCA